MSNEELVAAIQAGATERMGELWEQVKRFVVMKARRIPLEGRSDVELNDLIQSGYLALVNAVADYDPDGEYAFLTHLGYCLKTEFAKATHFRTARQKRETLTGTVSMQATIGNTEDLSLEDTIADSDDGPTRIHSTPEPGIPSVENRIYRQQLHEALEAALAALPEQSAEVLRLRYYQGLTLADAGEIRGTTAERIRQMENKAIRQLRKPSIACHLRPFYDFDFYCGAGLGAFQHTGMSIQERYLLIEEDRKERAEQRRKEKFQSEHEEIVDRVMQDAQAKVARMTQEEKRALLEKYGYA